MCLGPSVKMGESIVSTRFLLVFATFWTLTTSGDTIDMSSLLANTVSDFIEKVKNSDLAGDSEPDASSFPQTRGGHGGGHGGGYGGGGHGHGAITLDPVSIISLLALGAFLINNILQLLRANMTPAPAPTPPGRRSLSEVDALPLLMSTFHSNGPDTSNQPSFVDFFENVGSLYYLQPKKRNICMKRVVCNYLNMKESRESNPNHLKTKIFDFMLSTVTKLVAPEMSDTDKEEKCMRAQKFCSDALLKDARVSVEYKIYSQVSSWLTKLAFNGLTSG